VDSGTGTATEDARRAAAHVAALRRTFGGTPTWGMVEIAFRAGWLTRENMGGIPAGGPPGG
jgi:hypothetical protein